VAHICLLLANVRLLICGWSTASPGPPTHAEFACVGVIERCRNEQNLMIYSSLPKVEAFCGREPGPPAGPSFGPAGVSVSPQPKS